ncbi:triose-phosphate transporter family-domain-containing protein [Phyllosticta citribraziliensis]|uniref:Triose-phosphate transporter family-domain-containing protein n=1 Tax=Phyllosticta citribraziliensis TaxID=989973 RepID=A0ABR1LC60_9PEZI
MDNNTTTTNHSRRRSTSLIGPAATVGRSNSLRSQKGHRRTMSEHIPEAAEDKQDLDYGDSSSSGLDDEEGLTDDEETGLTSKDRRKRRRRKRRNTRLDERIASDVTISKEEEKIATATFVKASLINTTLIALWYFFSISISIYNKWMFAASEDGQSNLNFPFPLFTTCLHMVVQFTLASLVLYFFPKFRPRHDSLDSHHDSARAPPRREEPTDPNKPLMTKWFYCTRIGPCGAATGLDIGLGNMSLKFISLTFFTMCKSSVLGFVLLFAFIFRLEKPSWKLGAIILTMTVGVIMMVAGETAFNALGFILIMSSALASGFRWSLTQILLLRNPATSNPFSSIFFLAPVMFLSLFVIAVPVEGFAELWEGFAQLRAAKGLMLSILILMFPGTLAFLMTASEFALLKRTSVVTLSVCGIFKEIVTITAASLVFDDRLTTINVSGLLVTIGSIAAYNWIKVKQMHEDARLEARLAAEEYQPVLSAEPGDEYHVDGQRVGLPGSSSSRVRNSLSIQPVRDADRLLLGETAAQQQSTPVRQSPVKRPEDLD